MPFDPLKFYEFALWLVTVRTDEASLRSAISRLYYGGHLLAVQKLMQKGWQPTGRGDDHRGVIRELRNRRTRMLGDRLEALLELREHADYHREASLSVTNKGCTYCKMVRETPPADPNVTAAHWQNAKEVGEHLFPLLSKL